MRNTPDFYKQVPPRLKPGDKIAIAAPARKISREELQPAIVLMEGWGLEVITEDVLFASDHQFAGTDAQRIALLQKYIDDPGIKAVISARGGYGTVRIVDALDFSALRNHPKWIIGYSDLTVLHSHLFNHAACASLHATMPVNMQVHNLNTITTNALRNVLMQDVPLGYKVEPHRLNRPGEATGILVGGNLSVLYSLLGSSSDLDTNGKILFLEDLDEYLYHIDRMMQALKRAGKLDKLAGLLVGGMSDMRDNTVPYGHQAVEIISGYVEPFQYPAGFGFPAGHEPLNLPLIFGVPYAFSVSSQGLSINQVG